MADGSFPLYPPSKLDGNQIVQGAYNESTQRIRVESTSSIGDISLAIDLDSNEDGVHVADRDSGYPLKINSDGSINVEFTTGTIKSNYNEVINVASGVTRALINKILLVNTKLQKIEFSGSNIAEYELVIDGNTQDKKRTYFGSSLNGDFNFNSGIDLTVGQSIQVYVVHNRPSVGNFNCRMQFVEE